MKDVDIYVDQASHGRAARTEKRSLIISGATFGVICCYLLFCYLSCSVIVNKSPCHTLYVRGQANETSIVNLETSLLRSFTFGDALVGLVVGAPFRLPLIFNFGYEKGGRCALNTNERIFTVLERSAHFLINSQLASWTVCSLQQHGPVHTGAVHARWQHEMEVEVVLRYGTLARFDHKFFLASVLGAFTISYNQLKPQNRRKPTNATAPKITTLCSSEGTFKKLYGYSAPVFTSINTLSQT